MQRAKGTLGWRMPPEAIRHALARVHTSYEGAPSLIDWEDLIAAGLIVHPQAAARRMEMGNLLGIGYCNGKQFHKRLSVFQITREEFSTALAQIEREGL
ncbi:Ribonuclease M5 [compost metagenome]